GEMSDELYYALGMSYLRIEPPQTSDAIAALEQARDLGFSDRVNSGLINVVDPADVHKTLGLLYRDAGRRGDAIRELELFLKQSKQADRSTIRSVQGEIDALRRWSCMRALIVDSDTERVTIARTVLEAAGTAAEELSTWDAASPQLTSSTPPDIVVVAFDRLITDGLNSFLGVDAQLKVLGIPSLLVHSRAEASEVDAVRALASFGDTIELPTEGNQLVVRLNHLVSRVASDPVGNDASDVDLFGNISRFDDPALLTPGTLLDGRYEIEQFVAEGGMGHIYQ